MGNNFHKGKRILGSLPSHENELLLYMITENHASVIKVFSKEFDISWGKKKSIPHINLNEYMFLNGYSIQLSFTNSEHTITMEGEFMVIFSLDGKEYYGRFNVSDSKRNEDGHMTLDVTIDDYNYCMPHTLQQAALICNQHMNSHDLLTLQLFESLLCFFDNDYVP